MNVYRLNINGQQTVLTAFNCQVFIFKEGYEQFNHLYLMTDFETGDCVYIFDRQDLVDLLIKDGNFSYAYSPLVPQRDLEAYQIWQDRQVIETTATEAEPTINEGDLARFHDELEGGVNWDELDLTGDGDDGEEEVDGDD